MHSSGKCNIAMLLYSCFGDDSSFECACQLQYDQATIIPAWLLLPLLVGLIQDHSIILKKRSWLFCQASNAYISETSKQLALSKQCKSSICKFQHFINTYKDYCMYLSFEFALSKSSLANIIISAIEQLHISHVSKV